MAQAKTCPVCGHCVRPTFMQCFPPKGGYKQYPCPYCHTWLVISGASRLRTGIFGLVAGIPLLYIVQLGHAHRDTALWLSILFMLAWIAALGIFTRYTADWIAPPQ